MGSRGTVDARDWRNIEGTGGGEALKQGTRKTPRKLPCGPRSTPPPCAPPTLGPRRRDLDRAHEPGWGAYDRGAAVFPPFDEPVASRN